MPTSLPPSPTAADPTRLRERGELDGGERGLRGLRGRAIEVRRPRAVFPATMARLQAVACSDGGTPAGEELVQARDSLRLVQVAPFHSVTRPVLGGATTFDCDEVIPLLRPRHRGGMILILQESPLRSGGHIPHPRHRELL